MLQQLVSQWEEAAGALGRMSQGASVQPIDGWQIIQNVPASSDELARFEITPVVFNVPERGNHSNFALFVVVEGWLELRREEFRAERGLFTHAFATRAGYFRWNGHELEHVYGAHYDVALDQLGHPTFHSQMRSFRELSEHVRAQYNIDSPVLDRVDRVLRNVRLPTAQMDFFSFILQVFADHLLIKNATEEEKAAFNTLLKKSESLRGAARRSARLTGEVARLCYRSLHWYPLVP